jgi:uncharacterized membrane protein YfcA
MRWNLIVDLLFTIALIITIVFVFGNDVGDVLKEIAWFYGIMAVVGVALLAYIGRMLTKAMNPPHNKTPGR